MSRSNPGILGRIAMFSAFMSLCSWIVVPSAVPYSMQTFAVFLAAAVLGGKGAAVAVLVYIALGILGLPVFSGGRTGVGVLLGATGGYIIGFLPCAYIAGKLCEKTKRPIKMGLSMTLGLLCDYLIGSLWYFVVYFKGQGFWLALVTGILPFVVPDILKIILATVMATRLQKIE